MHMVRNRFYVLISLLMLALGMAGLVRQINVSLLPNSFSPESVQWPVTAQGIDLANVDDLIFMVEGLQPGDSLSLQWSTGQQTLITIPAYTSSYLIIASCSGLFFWVVAFFVFVPRLNLSAVSQFYWITMLYGLGILIGGVYFQFEMDTLGLILNLLQLCSLAFLPTVFLHLAMVFPRRVMNKQLTGNLTKALYLSATLLVIWQSQVFAQYFHTPTLTHASALVRPQNTADIFMIIQAVAAMIIILRQSLKLEPGRERHQVRWLLLGFFIGASPYLFLRTLPQLVSLTPPFPAHFDRLFEPAIPLAFIFAIARYRFLDIDIILRRGALYSLMAASVAGLVLIPTALMQPEKTVHWPRIMQALPVLLGLLAGILFLPLKRKLGLWIDRTFFRIEHRMDQILVRFQHDLKKVSSQEDLARLVHQRVNEAIRTKSSLVLVKTVVDEVRIGPRQTGPWTTPECCANAPSPLWVYPDHSTCPDQESDQFPPALVDDGFVVALNLEADDKAVGCVLLGPKQFGRRFVLTELKFLSEMAQITSARLQEISLVQTIVEEKLKRVQLDELHHLKDDFLSQVAHDLRTPITSVGWSLRNLLDGLAGDLTPRQKAYLNSMDNSLEHLGSLVSSLLEISRLKKAEVEISTQVCDLGPVLTRATETIRPLAEAADVNLQCTMDEPRQKLISNGPKLVEVLVNILENGVRYSPPGGVLEISSLVSGSKVHLTIRDHGPGFSGLSDPFARFAQGQPSPHTTDKGYGLGLTIAREYTQLMGGVIAARNHPQGGAEFTLQLPYPAYAEEGA